ncbi:MAG: hypothetical protein KBD10_02845 [Candidatus Pacebacteria bacterium]|nr:hypothetical protein [Candidatus Paceibacterota bacterium]
MKFTDTFTKDGIVILSTEFGESFEFEEHLEVFRQTAHSLPPLAVPKFELFLHPIQQYGKFPLARTVYGKLIDRQVADVYFSRFNFSRDCKSDWVGKIIIFYGSVFKVCLMEIYGFLAFSFNENDEVTKYFIPADAELGSTHYALCIKG